MASKYTQYGFVNYPSFVNNNPFEDSPVGEFPKYAYTFSLDSSTHTLQAYRDVRLINVETRIVTEDEGTKTSEIVKPNDDCVNISLRLGQFLFTRATNGFNVDDKANMMQVIVDEFKGVIDIRSLGKLVRKDSYIFPEYIAFSLLNLEEDNEVFLWFSGESFIASYPNYIHKPVLPLENMDLLFGTRESVVNLIEKISIDVHNRKIMDIRNDHQETHFETVLFNWTDRTNDEFVKPIPLSVVIYGPRGINIDAYKETWRKEILKDSQYSEDEWSNVLPELFTPTEFYIIPTWDKYALPNQVKSTGVYSSTVFLGNILQYAKQYAKGYSDAHLLNNTTVSGSTFNTIPFVAVGNEKNYKIPSRFDWAWPGFCAIDSRNQEFPKLSPDTQKLVMLLTELFYHCEIGTEYTLIPKGFTRLEREGVYYLTKSLNNVTYLMPLKDKFGLANPLVAIFDEVLTEDE